MGQEVQWGPLWLHLVSWLRVDLSPECQCHSMPLSKGGLRTPQPCHSQPPSDPAAQAHPASAAWLPDVTHICPLVPVPGAKAQSEQPPYPSLPPRISWTPSSPWQQNGPAKMFTGVYPTPPWFPDSHRLPGIQLAFPNSIHKAFSQVTARWPCSCPRTFAPAISMLPTASSPTSLPISTVFDFLRAHVTI